MIDLFTISQVDHYALYIEMIQDRNFIVLSIFILVYSFIFFTEAWGGNEEKKIELVYRVGVALFYITLAGVTIYYKSFVTPG